MTLLLYSPPRRTIEPDQLFDGKMVPEAARVAMQSGGKVPALGDLPYSIRK